VPETAGSGWLEVDLYWQSIAPVETDYQMGLRLVDAGGQIILAQRVGRFAPLPQ